MRYDFLLQTVETERLKTLSVWSQFQEADLSWRPEPRARSVLDHLVHQCQSEDGWYMKMLGLAIDLPVLPEQETRLTLLAHYADASRRRLQLLKEQDSAWFEAAAMFFGEARSRAWILVRRIAHTSHHRGQLTTYLRCLGRSLYSTYGPSADTGGLPAQGASVIYRYPSVDALLAAEQDGGAWPPLPGPGSASPTERRRDPPGDTP
jgi:uncharacterized damage-inducible protein DinB